MADFPSIQLPYSRKATVSKPQVKHEFESGTNQVRSRGTRAKEKWNLSWEHLPASDWELLKTHFKENSGNSFAIAKEMINEAANKTVIYSIDEISKDSSNITGFFKIEIQVEEM